MENISIRPARPAELATVAALRWEWFVENGSADLGERDDFVRHFVAWAGENAGSHRCMVLVRDEQVIGMAWLAVVQRVPTPRAPRRASGDLQCVYVVPEARDGGLGGRLIRAVLDGARELGLERVTVHSSPRAVPAYARSGFQESPRLLQAQVGRA
ncbi:GNAT family N-acetyltransferase [Streptomyces sp. 378]|uniref:GNAT family N-acetyltransferase n=1 Tax=Streptomyces sp. 378 TaxID=3049412 RepID=UPI0024C41C09|nr:GNAT family N-acetyltransferase [Streptomyces sp. 378]MDK1345243.1 GNAT family N-acetyltransferase [Streptomyces sp. 378]